MEKCPKDAEDAEVGELCGCVPPHPDRCPDISSITSSFKPFLIAWLWEYCTFSDSSVVSLKSSSWPKYNQYRTIFHQFEGNFLRLAHVCARTHVRALMMQKLCAVRMRNAIPRNYLNLLEEAKATLVLSIFFVSYEEKDCYCDFSIGQVGFGSRLILRAQPVYAVSSSKSFFWIFFLFLSWEL